MSVIQPQEIKSLPRRCSQCNMPAFAQYPPNFDFCAHCQAPLVQPHSFEEILGQVIRVGSLIFQHQPETFTIQTTAGELKFYGVQKASEQHLDGSIDVIFDLSPEDDYGLDLNNPLYTAPPMSYRHHNWLLDSLGINHIYPELGGKGRLYDILRALIEFEITEPVSIARGHTFYMRANRDCWPECKLGNYCQAFTQCPDNTLIELRILYTIPRTYQQPKPVDDRLIRLLAVAQEYSRSGNVAMLNDTKNMLDTYIIENNILLGPETPPPQPRQLPLLTLGHGQPLGIIDQMRQSLIRPEKPQQPTMPQRPGMPQLPSMPQLGTAQNNLPGINTLDLYREFFRTDPPINYSYPTTPEDIALRNALAQINEDVYYSKRTKQLYSLDQLQTLFQPDLNVFALDPTFRDGSKHLQILNVNTYTLNPVYDALFTFSDLRQSLTPLATVNTYNGFPYPALLYELGLGPLPVKEAARPPIITPFETKRVGIPQPHIEIGTVIPPKQYTIQGRQLGPPPIPPRPQTQIKSKPK